MPEMMSELTETEKFEGESNKGVLIGLKSTSALSSFPGTVDDSPIIGQEPKPPVCSM